jgi:tRNA U54 and U55 pseudouridine synthase Pus10
MVFNFVDVQVKATEILYNRVLRDIVDAPWYIRNDNLHKDLTVETINSVIKKYAQRHEQRLHRHTNVEALQLLDNGDLVRRLHRPKPFELVSDLR